MDGHLGTSSTLAASTAMWLAMVVVMMTPVAAPWVRAYTTLLMPGVGTHPWTRALPFVAGYGLVWSAYSLVMAVAQTSLSTSGALVGGRLSTTAGSVVLLAAGAFQFTRFKAACLAHCRNPLSFFLARWHDGPSGGFRLGLAHGLFCLGCCWLMMATGFVLGVMHLGWMALVMAVAIVEQLTPQGPAVGRLFGAALGAWAVVRLL